MSWVYLIGLLLFKQCTMVQRVRLERIVHTVTSLKLSWCTANISFKPIAYHYSLEALSREFHTSCPWELPYADDLVLIAQTLDLLMEKLKLWKNNMENKGLRVNMGETKVMICGKVLDTIKLSGKCPCM